MEQNKKAKKIEEARHLAIATSMRAVGLIIFWLILFNLLGVFSSESPFSAGEKLGYSLAVLVPTVLVVLILWVRYLSIRNALSDDDDEQKD